MEYFLRKSRKKNASITFKAQYPNPLNNPRVLLEITALTKTFLMEQQGLLLDSANFTRY